VRTLGEVVTSGDAVDLSEQQVTHIPGGSVLEFSLNELFCLRILVSVQQHLNVLGDLKRGSRVAGQKKRT
jgi:hypothetical protein